MMKMTLAEAVSTLEEFFDKFIWLATPAHGNLPDRAGAALKFLKEALQEWEVYYTGEIAERVYRLTKALRSSDDPEELQRVLLEFQRILEEEDCYIPIQEAFFLWQSGRIPLQTLIIFLEDSYKLSSTMRGKNEAVRWMITTLWRLAVSNVSNQ